MGIGPCDNTNNGLIGEKDLRFLLNKKIKRPGERWLDWGYFSLPPGIIIKIVSIRFLKLCCLGSKD